MKNILFLFHLIAILALTTLMTAQATTIEATTSGIFSATGTASYGHLAFTSGSFSVTTDGLGNATISGTLLTDSLGQFALTNGTFTYNTTFTLNVTFSAPTGTNSGPFSANVNGSVTGSNGNLSINFGPAQLVTYDTGSFMLQVNGVSWSGTTGNRQMGGSVTNDQSSDPPGVPEDSSTAALLALAMTGIAVLRSKLASVL